MWEVYAYGMLPYPELKNSDIFERLKTGYLMKCPEDCPAQVYDLMRHCWEWEPGDRPTFRKISIMLASMFDIEGEINI